MLIDLEYLLPQLFVICLFNYFNLNYGLDDLLTIVTPLFQLSTASTQGRKKKIDQRLVTSCAFAIVAPTHSASNVDRTDTNRVERTFAERCFFEYS